MYVFHMTAKNFGSSSLSLVASLSVAAQAMAFALPEQASAGLVPWRPTKLRIETIAKKSKSARVTINGKPVAVGDSAKLKELVQTTDKTTATARI
jgi:enoyl-CoA hydratase/carnithine racemase